MARNLIRYIDQIPFFYAVGVVAVFATRQHQRLGDMAAGTLVVRDRESESGHFQNSGARTLTLQLVSPSPPLPEPHSRVSLPPAAVVMLSPSDLEVLEGFLARRYDMPMEPRQALAARLAEAIGAKSGLELPAGSNVETFLEAVARDLRDTLRLR
jgi:hypothetical protein